jgi:ADP-heptose:LPS heptosyltransferase
VNAGPAPPVVVSLRALGLGDLLTAVPALRAVRRAFPRHRHLLLAPAHLEPVARASGAVDQVVPVDAVRGFDGSPPTDLPSGPAVAVNLHGRGPQSHRLLLDLFPGRLIAHRHDLVPQSWTGPDWSPGQHEVRRWCDLLVHCGIPADPSDLHLPPPPGAPRRRPGTTVIHPGASSASRRWPPERFAQVAAARRRSGDEVFVTGSTEEAALVEEVVAAAHLGRSADRSGTSLGELMALVASAGRVVCGDTGMAHLATAHRTPSVVLFGPVAPETWGPPVGGGRHVALWSGRLGDPHGDHVDRGLLEIQPADVLAALDGLDRVVDDADGPTRGGGTGERGSRPGPAA